MIDRQDFITRCQDRVACVGQDLGPHDLLALGVKLLNGTRQALTRLAPNAGAVCSISDTLSA